ncbi:MAG: hypothetical protein R3F07_05025 [Opitutaceae bacterium]
MNASLPIAVCILATFPAETGLTMEAVWKETVWRGEAAHEARTEEWRAIVSSHRGRLVHFGPVEDGSNLLYESPEAAALLPGGDFPEWGGHRFWLGPQKSWEWPPHPDWEYSPAAEVVVEGERLVVVMPRTDDHYPKLTREYFWSGDRLGCLVRWSVTDRPYYAMQIFAVPSSTRVEAEPVPTVDVPLGFVRVTWDFPERPAVLPPGAVAEPGGLLVLRPAGESVKLGFPPQKLRGVSDRFILQVSPAATTGRVIHPPDAGFLSQVWVCSAGGAVVEIEQISPYLLPDGDEASSLVFLEGIPTEGSS